MFIGAVRLAPTKTASAARSARALACRRGVLAGAVVLAAAGIALAAAGDLDTTFGTSGIVDIALLGDPNWIEVDCEVRSDGRIILAGSDEVDVPYMRWAFRSFLANGNVDTSFGTNGMVTVFGTAYDDWLHDITLDDIGRILAVGRSSIVTTTTNGKKANTTTQIVGGLARITASGQLDSTFGTGGTVRTQVPGAVSTVTSAVAAQSDGKVLVAGSATFEVRRKGGWYYNQAIYLARYLANGSPDAAFGTNGITIYDRTDGSDRPLLGNAIAIQSDGKIVLGSRSGNSDFADEWTLTRFLPNGALDNSYVVTSPGDRLKSITIDASDRIVAVGMRSRGLNLTDMLAMRYTASGALDASFGSGGATTIDIGDLDILIGPPRFQSDGRIVCCGIVQPLATSGDDHGVVVRLHGNGTLDSGFGYAGIAGPIALSPTTTEPWAAALAPDGLIVVAGRYWGGEAAPHWFLTRFLAQ